MCGRPWLDPYLLGGSPYLLGVASEHGVDQFDTMGESRGHNITGPIRGEEEEEGEDGHSLNLSAINTKFIQHMFFNGSVLSFI